MQHWLLWCTRELGRHRVEALIAARFPACEWDAMYFLNPPSLQSIRMVRAGVGGRQRASALCQASAGRAVARARGAGVPATPRDAGQRGPAVSGPRCTALDAGAAGGPARPMPGAKPQLSHAPPVRVPAPAPQVWHCHVIVRPKQQQEQAQQRQAQAQQQQHPATEQQPGSELAGALAA